MYEIYCKLRDERGLKDSDVVKQTGITKSTFSDWKSGRSKPKNDKLQKIADFFGVTVDYLISGNTTADFLYTCPDCGLSYCTNLAEDCNYHTIHHNAWKKAVMKFGELYCNSSINEKIKSENRAIRNNLKNSIDDRYNAELKVLRCLFSRSVSACDFNLNHVTFDKYVAMMLNTEKYRNQLGDELSRKLIAKYGTMPGIKNGESYYNLPADKEKLSQRDKRDIKKDVDSIMEKLTSKEYGPAAYNGEDLSEESASLFKEELEIALKRLKLINKEKYNPNKNKK